MNERTHTHNTPDLDPGRTADGYPITDGMAVWDYNLERGYVRLADAFEDGGPGGPVWFLVVPTPDARLGHSMNGERVCIRHPFTGESANPNK